MAATNIAVDAATASWVDRLREKYSKIPLVLDGMSAINVRAYVLIEP